jgi:hypothetical protein
VSEEEGEAKIKVESEKAARQPDFKEKLVVFEVSLHDADRVHCTLCRNDFQAVRDTLIDHLGGKKHTVWPNRALLSHRVVSELLRRCSEFRRRKVRPWNIVGELSKCFCDLASVWTRLKEI